jgi:NADPH-dependent glutamate synthase beta subunit-like oxidoreductase
LQHTKKGWNNNRDDDKMTEEQKEKIKAWRCSKCGGIYVDETCSCPIWNKSDKPIILIDRNKILEEFKEIIKRHKWCGNMCIGDIMLALEELEASR